MSGYITYGLIEYLGKFMTLKKMPDEQLKLFESLKKLWKWLNIDLNEFPTSSNSSN